MKIKLSDLWRFAPGTHWGILLVRLNAPSQRNLIERISQIFAKADVDEWQRCFVVATERKVRIRRSL
jgi:hypothetical protein